jgi:hypothetical protein
MFYVYVSFYRDERFPALLYKLTYPELSNTLYQVFLIQINLLKATLYCDIVQRISDVLAYEDGSLTGK